VNLYYHVLIKPFLSTKSIYNCSQVFRVSIAQPDLAVFIRLWRKCMILRLNRYGAGPIVLSIKKTLTFSSQLSYLVKIGFSGKRVFKKIAFTLRWCIHYSHSGDCGTIPAMMCFGFVSNRDAEAANFAEAQPKKSTASASIFFRERNQIEQLYL